MPDQLVFATVSALLRIASDHEEYRATATGAIVKFAEQIVWMLKSGEGTSTGILLHTRRLIRHIAEDILAQFAPAFHGFYRSIISIPFAWSLHEWASLSRHLNALFDPSVVDMLNRLLVDALRREDDVEKPNARNRPKEKNCDRSAVCPQHKNTNAIQVQGDGVHSGYSQS